MSSRFAPFTLTTDSGKRRTPFVPTTEVSSTPPLAPPPDAPGAPPDAPAPSEISFEPPRPAERRAGQTTPAAPQATNRSRINIPESKTSEFGDQLLTAVQKFGNKESSGGGSFRKNQKEDAGSVVLNIEAINDKLTQSLASLKHDFRSDVKKELQQLKKKSHTPADADREREERQKIWFGK
jgi:hypothetical protein